MDAASIVTIIVACVAAASAYASQRAAAKASMLNTTTTSRVDMEREAYERARAFDTETITRQDREIVELRATETELRKEVKRLERRVRVLELGLPPEADAEGEIE